MTARPRPARRAAAEEARVWVAILGAAEVDAYSEAVAGAALDGLSSLADVARVGVVVVPTSGGARRSVGQLTADRAWALGLPVREVPDSPAAAAQADIVVIAGDTLTGPSVAGAAAACVRGIPVFVARPRRAGAGPLVALPAALAGDPRAWVAAAARAGVTVPARPGASGVATDRAELEDMLRAAVLTSPSYTGAADGKAA